VLTGKDGQLLSQRKVLKSQLRTQPECGRNQTKQSQNRQHHGQRVSDSMVRKVNPMNEAGVFAMDRAKTSDMIADPLIPNRFLYLPANLIRDGNMNCIPNATPFACLASIYDPLDDMLPRHIYRRPGTYFQDVAFAKNILVSESVRIQLRAEFYNLLNHANLEIVGNLAASGMDLSRPWFAGGTIGGVVATYGGAPRQVVLAAKILF
jgi:hypothetical protein